MRHLDHPRVVHGPFGRASVQTLVERQPPHAHGQPQLLLVLGGGGVLADVAGQQIELRKGDGLLIGPMTRHALDMPNTESADILSAHLDPGWLSNTLGLTECPGGATDACLRLDAAAAALARLTADAVGMPQPALHATQSSLERFVRYAWQAWWCGPPVAPCPIDRRLQRSLGQMRQDVSARAPIEALARDSGLSRPHFFKLFQQTFRLTPTLYLNMLRMERAVQEIAATDKAVGLVAADLGFSAQANFTRFFRGIEGMSPSAYRRAAALGLSAAQ